MTRVGWLAVAIALGTVALFALFPPRAPREVDPGELPWQVTADGRGGSTVFGIIPGVSSLGEAAARWSAEPQLSLFRDADGRLALEGFFDGLRLAGLKADLVVTLELPDSTLAAFRQRGTPARRSSPGVTRIGLDPADLPAAHAAPIGSLTYLPAIDLAPELLRQRFGAPAEQDAAGADELWLYPGLGLAITVREREKEVFQYVAPRQFERLRGAVLRILPD